MGLGTAAVDRTEGSYPRLVSLDMPHVRQEQLLLFPGLVLLHEARCRESAASRQQSEEGFPFHQKKSHPSHL